MTVTSIKLCIEFHLQSLAKPRISHGALSPMGIAVGMSIIKVAFSEQCEYTVCARSL